MQPPLRKKFASFAHGKIQIKFKKKTLRELAKGGIKFEIQARFFLLLMTKMSHCLKQNGLFLLCIVSLFLHSYLVDNIMLLLKYLATIF